MDPAQISAVIEAMPWSFPVLAAVLGAVMASFSGVVAARLPHQIGWKPDPEPGLTIAWPPSRCDSCRRRLDPLEIVPIFGWIAARGRCRSCGVGISVAYPMIEAATAAASALIAWWIGPGIEAVWLLVILWASVALVWLDVTEHLLPDAITLPLFWAGLALSPWEIDPNARILGAFAGFAAVWASFAITGMLCRAQTMSGGDIALASAAGAWLGLDGIPVFLGVACATFLILAVPLRTRGIVWVPMGPSLCVSLLACLIAMT